jgi:hypothetical protein
MRGRLLAVVVVAAVVAIGAGLLWRVAAPSTVTQAKLRAAVLRYDAARESAWPEDLIWRPRFTAAERERLQREYMARMRAVAAGDALEECRGVDFAGQLDLQADGGREVWTSVRCRIEVWEFLRRTLDGGVVVRAGVSVSPTSGQWDAKSGGLRRVHTFTYAVAPVSDYTLKNVDGRWVVTAVDGSPMDYDVASGTFGNG